MVNGHIEKMLAIGKEKRPAMGSVLIRVDLRDRLCSSSADTDTHDGRGRGRSEDDHSARRPGAAAAKLRLSDRLRRSAVEINRLQLAVGEESERVAVRRPEGKDRILSVGKRMGLQRVHGTNPERRLPVRAGGCKRDGCTVWRQHRRPGSIAGEIERGLIRRIDDGADGLHRLGGTMEEAEHSDGRTQGNRAH